MLAFNSACYTKNTKTTTNSTQPISEKENAEEKYFEEMDRIFNRGMPNMMSEYYRACDDFLNLDISLSEHKEATGDFVRRIYVLNNAYEKLEPPDKAKEVHNLFGISVDHYYNGAEYLNKYIESNDINEMNQYLEKAVSEMEMAAKYLNEANEEMKDIN